MQIRLTPAILAGFLAVASAQPIVIPSTRPADAFDIMVDSTSTPDLNVYAHEAQQLAYEWYPKIAALLPSDGYTPPRRVWIEFAERNEGVAWAAGNRITCVAKWFRERPQDRGAIVHELVHIVQHYGQGEHPGWLTEGIADYIRFYHYEPEARRPKPNAQRSTYSDSYQTTAHFLNWAQSTYAPDLVEKLNAACRAGTYKPEIWKTLTGKDLDTLGAEWKGTLGKG